MEAVFAIAWSALRAGSAVLLTACLVTAVMRRRSASARHAVWIAALCGMALMAFLAAVPAGWWSPAVAFEMPAIQVLVRGGAASPSPAGYGYWFVAGWLAVAAVLLGSLAGSHVRASLQARRAKALDEDRGGVQLLESPLGQGPMMWGFFRPIVFLPRGAERWNPMVREAVLQHELAHCQRMDCLWLLLARTIASLFWFQPLAWLALYRIGAEGERAADDFVLRTGVSAGDYANWLITIARETRCEPAAALAMGRSSEFEGRLKAVLDERMNRGNLSRKGAIALAAGVCLVLLPFAAAQKTESDETVYKMSDGITAPVLIDKVEPQYTEAARDAKVIGTVLLTVQIDKAGAAQNITVVEGLPMGLDEKAVEAIKQWRFKPGMKDGKPVHVQANIEINFKLK